MHFGLECDKFGEAYRSMQEPIPYCEDAQLHLVDRLDRYDLSGLNIEERIAEYTSQDERDEVTSKLTETLNRCKQVYKEIRTYKPELNIREFDLLVLSLKTHIHKCKLGLAFDEAVSCLKYPHPEDKNLKKELVEKLNNLIFEQGS